MNWRAAIVREDAEDAEEMEKIIKEIEASPEYGNLVLVADSFRLRDNENRPCSIDPERLVSGRVIDTVIFFSRRKAEFWKRMFPILKKAIFITGKEKTNWEGEDGIIFINQKDVPQYFKNKFIV